ncbi:32274_t:CDS:2, partial [Gigaspora margarita]
IMYLYLCFDKLKFLRYGGAKFPISSDTIFNDIQILDTLSLTWTQGSNVNAPIRRIDFTATLLNNGLILYIGGSTGIPTYNTNNNSWNTTIATATGDTVDSRSCHTAVLSPDGHVVIYGGSNPHGPINQCQNLAVLDTTVNPYQWFIKPITGAMYANNSFNNLSNVNSNIYLLDTRNYMWTIDTLHYPDLTISPHNTLNT